MNQNELRGTIKAIMRLKHIVKNPDRITGSYCAYMAELLSDLPYQTVKAAINRYALNGDFAPSPGDIRKMTQTNQFDAETEWQKIVAHMRGRYYTGYPKDLKPESLAVLKGLGRWRELCSQPVDQLNFTKRHFLQGFNAMSQASEIVKQLGSPA